MKVFHKIAESGTWTRINVQDGSSSSNIDFCYLQFSVGYSHYQEMKIFLEMGMSSNDLVDIYGKMSWQCGLL